MKMYVYIKYETGGAGLPIAIADSVKELSKITGDPAHKISSRLWRNRTENRVYKYAKVEIED